MRGGWGEEDSIAIVACGHEMVRLVWERAEERKSIGRCGTETCPGFQLRGVGQGRKQCGSKGMQMRDVRRVDGFVEAGVLYCCSDDGAAGVGAGGSGDYIDVGGADD
jgi:hypothetical protein